MNRTLKIVLYSTTLVLTIGLIWLYWYVKIRPKSIPDSPRYDHPFSAFFAQARNTLREDVAKATTYKSAASIAQLSDTELLDYINSTAKAIPGIAGFATYDENAANELDVRLAKQNKVRSRNYTSSKGYFKILDANDPEVEENKNALV